MPKPRLLVRLCAGMLLLVAVAAAAASADAAADAQRLLAAGDGAAALRSVELALAKQPNDAGLRFVRAVILSDQRRDDEALEAYQRLTEDYPDLAGPFNNLSVLLAARGQLDAARAALEHALRLDPGNATARQNLGDLYLRLALQAWEQSAVKDRPDPALQRKLRLARELQAGAAPAAAR